MDRGPQVHVLASFDAQLVTRPLGAWLAEAGMPLPITCQPPAPLASALLHAVPACRAGHIAAHVLLAHRHELAEAEGLALADALADHARVCAAPVVVGMVPLLEADTGGVPSGTLSPSLEGMAAVPVLMPELLCDGLTAAPHDPWLAERTGIPFTSAFFQHAARAIARALHATMCPPAKVLVLDGDGTLWDGIAGEDGPEQVVLSPRALAVQAFARAQRDQGVLLAIASKNIEADVRAVFERRDAGHLLTWNDFAATRVNWQTKAENLASLSAELRLPLDSFVLLDDSSVECAHVHAAHPQVVCLEAPATADATALLLRNCWMFDAAHSTTAESARRRELYEADRDREAVRASRLDYRDFLDALQVQVTIGPATPDDVARVAELSVRTNQFNLVRSRESEMQVRQALADGAARFVVRAADRFGDYGLVGVLGWEAVDAALEVAPFLLSCRALGRGVEHAMLRYAAADAVAHGCETLRLPYAPAPRSEPAQRFLDALPAATRSRRGDQIVYELPTTVAAQIDAVTMAEYATYATPGSEPPKAALAPAATAVSRARGRERIAARHRDASETFSSPIAASPTSVERRASSRSLLEQEITDVWREVLGVPDIDVDQRFADLGGSSLQLIDVFAALAERGHRDLNFVDLFRHTSVRSLAAFLSRDTVAEGAAMADHKGPPHVREDHPHPHQASPHAGLGIRQREAFAATAKRAQAARL